MKSMKMMMVVKVLPMKRREGEGDVVGGDGWRDLLETRRRTQQQGKKEENFRTREERK